MHKKLLPLWIIVIIDVLLIGASLLVFAYFHHVAADMQGIAFEESGPADFTRPPRPTAPSGQETEEPAAPSGNSQPAESTGPLLDVSGDFGQQFPEKFSEDGEIIQTESSYKSHDVALEFSQVSFRDNVYFVIDAYIRNIDNFASYVTESRGESFDKLMKKSGIFAAVSGDYVVNAEVAVRNGNIIKQAGTISHDLCVLYYDGTLETVSPAEFNWEKIAAKAPYQIWSFGPALLDGNGLPLETFNTSVAQNNPRSAIGYYAPGHYCLVAVEGRFRIDEAGNVVPGQSGATMRDLSDFMGSIGCVAAYNFDGGVSTHMGFNSETVTNIVTSDGYERAIWDLVGIREIH